MQFSTKIKLKNTVIAIIFAVIAIIIPAYILNKWFEAVFFFICHWIIRNQFKYQYHCPTHAQCRIVTTVIFVVGMAIIIPLRFSLLSIIFLCYIIAYVGQLQKQYNTSVAKLERLTKPKLFDCETCSESELIERCDELRLSKDNKQLAIDFFIHKTKQSVIADQLCINEKSVQIRKKRLKEKLNTK